MQTWLANQWTNDRLSVTADKGVKTPITVSGYFSQINQNAHCKWCPSVEEYILLQTVGGLGGHFVYMLRSEASFVNKNGQSK